MAPKTLGILMLAALVSFAPLAAAEYSEHKEECPPDMMCTTSAPSRGEGDGSGERAPPEDEPEQYEDNEEDRRYAVPDEDTSTSNETAQRDDDADAPKDGGNAWVENCPPDRACAFGNDGAGAPEDGDDDAAPAPERSEAGPAPAKADRKDAPGIGVIAIAAALGAVGAVVRSRR